MAQMHQSLQGWRRICPHGADDCDAIDGRVRPRAGALHDVVRRGLRPPYGASWDSRDGHLHSSSCGPPHLYRLRPTGASHDFLRGSRTVETIQLRGLLRDARSFRRFQHSARVAKLFSRLPLPVQRPARLCAQALPLVMRGVAVSSLPLRLSPLSSGLGLSSTVQPLDSPVKDGPPERRSP